MVLVGHTVIACLQNTTACECIYYASMNSGIFVALTTIWLIGF